jgi:hypothetical protein
MLALVPAACSPATDYPSLFPSTPQRPKSEAPMDDTQLQQATESLITERNHLSSQMQSGTPKQSTDSTPTGSTATRPKAAANASAAAGSTAGQDPGQAASAAATKP